MAMNKMLMDTIKIKYVELGYLPNWPYHMISDDEVLRAFIINDVNFYQDNYFCSFDLYDIEIWKMHPLQELTKLIWIAVKHVLQRRIELPNWIYPYMLGEVVGPKSSTKDIDDLIELCNLKGIVPSGEMSPTLCITLFKISYAWLTKLPRQQLEDEYRMLPTIFGEPHVIKSLRLAKLDGVNGEEWIKNAVSQDFTFDSAT